MDLSMLDRLSTDTLKAMQTRIGELLNGRLDTRVIPGRRATFADKTGLVRTVRIDKLNRATASCIEIEPESGKKWRVGYNLLTVEPVARKVPIAPPAIKTAAPATRADDAW